MIKELKLSDKQLYSLGDSTGRVNLWEGSIRSGKTFATILRFFTALAANPTGGQIAICGKNKDTIYRNFFAPIESDETLAFIRPAIKYQQGASHATMLGRTVHIIGANDARAEARIRGMTIALAYMDEATIIPETFFKQILGRMSPPGAQLFATTNPDSSNHWLKTSFLDRLDQLENWKVYHFSLDDNPALTEAYKSAIKSEYSGLFYRRFILGEWVSAEGAVYDMYDPDKHIIEWEQLPPMKDIIAVGMDYGTTNPTAAVMLGQAATGELYFIDEWRLDETNRGHASWTDAQQSRAFTEWLENAEHHPYMDAKPRFILLDPAAASFKAQLAADGVKHLRNADNNVLYGIKTMATALASGWLFISDKCGGIIQEITGYSWDEKASREGKDKPIKVADHSLDAARYALTSTEMIWRKRLPKESYK